MSDLVFFYGTLMRALRRPRGGTLDRLLRLAGRGWIRASLFDLGPYPGAIQSADGLVWGDVHRMARPAAVLRRLDEIEDCQPGRPDSSLYVRRTVEVTLEQDGGSVVAWVYFYNAAPGNAPRIESGDYLAYLSLRRTALPAGDSGCPSSALERFDEVRNDGGDPLRRLDELDP